MTVTQDAGAKPGDDSDDQLTTKRWHPNGWEPQREIKAPTSGVFAQVQQTDWMASAIGSSTPPLRPVFDQRLSAQPTSCFSTMLAAVASAVDRGELTQLAVVEMQEGTLRSGLQPTDPSLGRRRCWNRSTFPSIEHKK